MADFCQQCSIENFGEDHQDLADLETDPASDFYVEALCEGCGETLVDRTGRCVAIDCLKLHGGA